MKILHTTVASLLTAGALVSVAEAQLPIPVIQYETPVDGTGGNTSVPNSGSSGVSGTLTNPGSVSIVAGPDDGAPPAGAFHLNGSGGGIATNQTLGSVIAPNGSFTMAAYVNVNDANGDHMVFGTDGGNPVHIGFRGGNAYFAFWGNDSGGGATPVGAWHEFTWVYNATAVSGNQTGEQAIYDNGTLVSDSFGHAAPGQTGQNLTVGFTGSGQNYNGGLDDIRVYNSAFSQAQVNALQADMATVDAVPEPSTWMAAGGLLLLAAGDLRRRLKS